MELGSTLSSGIFNDDKLCSRSILIMLERNLIFVLGSLKFILFIVFRIYQNKILNSFLSVLIFTISLFNIKIKFSLFWYQFGVRPFIIFCV